MMPMHALKKYGASPFRHSRLCVSFLITLCSYLSMASLCYGWFSIPTAPFAPSTHEAIANRAFQAVAPKLRNNFLRTKANYTDTNDKGYLWFTYTKDNDENAHGDEANGIITPNGARNGGDKDVWFQRFLTEYRQGPTHYAKAEEYLGYCIHLIQDMNVPAHAYNIPHSFSDVEGFLHTGDNFEWTAAGLPITTYDISELAFPPNPATFYYDVAKANTIAKVKREGFGGYWIEGVEGVDDEYGDDGPKGHYGGIGGADKFTGLTLSQSLLLLDQLNTATDFVGKFLLGVDRILSADSVNEDDYEDDDTMDSANAIEVPFYDNDLRCNDDDWFEVWVQTGEKISVNMNFIHSNGDLDLYLYDAWGNQVAASQGASNQETINFGPSSSNDYFYIKVHGYIGARNSYSLGVTTYTTNSPDLRNKLNKAGSSFVTEGNPFWVSEYIYNSGLSTAGASHARLFLSTNGQYDTYNSYYLGEAPVGQLAPLTGQWVTWSFTMPSLGSGSYPVWTKVMVDSRNEVYEENEDYSPFVSMSNLFTAYDVRTLTGLAIVGPSSVIEKSTSAYTAIATWSDGTTATVTPTWSESSSYASINSAGQVTTTEVSGNKLLTLIASYTFAGITKSEVKNVTILDMTATLTGLKIHGPGSVVEGASAMYLATAEWSDGTSTVVTPGWSENSAYASINSGGILTAASVSADQADVVTASYTFAGVTKTATKPVTIVNSDAVPDQFSFSPVVGAPLNAAAVSNTITVSGINSAAPISITGGSYSISGGSYTTAAGTASNGSTVTVQLTSAATYSTTRSATITIGGVSATFTVTTAGPPDTTPNPFSFTPQVNVAPNTVTTSNSITVSGINTRAPISITGGSYSISGGSYTTAAGTVPNGSTVTVRVTSAASYSTARSATLTIGGVSGTFTVTTVGVDTTPNAFSFTPQTNVALGTVATSNSITVSGINTPAPITIAGGSYSISGGSYTTAAGTVSSGSTVAIRLTSAASYSTPRSATLAIGGVSATFTVITAAADTIPNPFSFTPQTALALSTITTSNSVTVSGINAPAPISITGGSYSISGGAYTTAPGTVANGSAVTLRVTSAATGSTAATAVLVIGGVSGTFVVTTLPLALPPQAIEVPQTGQATCYDASGATVTCKGTGQDGEAKMGKPWPVPRFVDNGDGTMSDRLTGLIWSKNANPAGGARTWQAALDYIKSLNSANYSGHNDWRLPNRNEMGSLLHQGLPSHTWLSGSGFSNVQSGNSYVTSSSLAENPGYQWLTGLNGNSLSYFLKSYSYYIWPVRGQTGTLSSLALPKTGETTCSDGSGAAVACSGTGQDGALQTGVTLPTPRFTDNADESVTDEMTGLIWAKDGDLPDSRKSWQGALDFIKVLNSVNYLGHGDWRLPNSSELLSLVNLGKASQSNWLNSQSFRDIRPANYWTSTTVSWYPTSAKVVDMYSGLLAGYTKTDGDCYLWPVRSGVPGRITINNGASTTNAADVALSLYYPGATAMQLSSDGVNWSAWSSFTTTMSYTLPSGDGLKTVRVRFKDSNGAPSNLHSATINLDSTPPTGSVTINGRAAYTRTANVTLALSAMDATGVAQVCVSNTAACSAWSSYATSKAWTLAPGDGIKSVNVWFKDTLGNISSKPYAAIITLDATAPANATLTITPAVSAFTLKWQVASDATSGVAGYRLVAGPTTYPACTATPLYSGTGTAFIHNGITTGTTYYYRLCTVDKAGNTSSGATAIKKALPEYTAPAGSVAINGRAAYTKTANVTLALSASDASGVSQMCLSNTAICPAWTPYAATKGWTLAAGDGAKTVRAWFKDSLGNVSSAPNAATITLDTTAPANAVLSLTPATHAMTLKWQGASDATSGIAGYRLVAATTGYPACTVKPIYSGAGTSFIHSGLITGTTYYYRLCTVDKAGNTSSGATAAKKAL